MDILRTALADAYRRPETECVPPLIAEARMADSLVESARDLALSLVAPLRDKRVHDSSGVEGLIQEYSLSTDEGIALMCLAEALLRIPDAPTRDALIRDKISGADWAAHLGNSPSLLVNAATWALLVTGKMTATTSEGGLYSALTRLIGKGGEPLIRKGVDMAMRLMGEQFVTGQTIQDALANSRKMESRGFRYSYDCLGEAATTSADAERYYADYERAIHAIGQSAQRDGRPLGIYEGPGISVKLSALHPRYSRAQRDRVTSELIPRLKMLTVLARHYDIAINIDAEEADRLELSLQCLEALCFDPALEGWNGIGFVIQAYQKRCRFLVDWIIDLARRSRHRLMIRLVKGAYWDSEIKRAQIDGLDGFPVFTRKVYTDVSYLACARRLLTAPEAVFPQFATHNAHTLATIVKMAGENYYAGQYEFQCLHGMGEPLYEEVVGADKLNRPCRIYAPVGTHETLLAYLVRRLLENGANTSFVNRIADASIPIDELVVDPVAVAGAIRPVGAAHPRIALPSALFGATRRNSAGLDLSDDERLREVDERLGRNANLRHASGPQIDAPLEAETADAPPDSEPRRPPRPRRIGGVRLIGSGGHRLRAGCREPGRVEHHPGRRSRPPARDRGRPPGGASPRSHQPPGSGGRQIDSELGRRDSRGGGFPALLRGAGTRALRYRASKSSGPCGLYFTLEFSARDLPRTDRRRARCGQYRTRQARRGNPVDRPRSHSVAAPGRYSPGRSSMPARRRHRGSGAGHGSPDTGRDVHRLHRRCADDPGATVDATRPP